MPFIEQVPHWHSWCDGCKCASVHTGRIEAYQNALENTESALRGRMGPAHRNYVYRCELPICDPPLWTPEHGQRERYTQSPA